MPFEDIETIEMLRNKDIQEYKEMMFLEHFNEIQKSVYENAVAKGWWDEPERNQAELIALMHSELSEGLEALRKYAKSDKLPQFEGIEEELADTIIRIMDAAEGFGWRVAEALIEKMKYNTGREYRHGNKAY